MDSSETNSIRIISQKVAVNEYVTKFLVNKLSYILLQNDINTYNFYKYFVMSGPSVFVNGAKYEKGYKVWADGWYRTERGEIDRQFGIFISAKDNNTDDPESIEGIDSWIRFTIYDIREYNVNVFKIIKDYINAHLTEYHENVTIDNTLLLLRSLENIAYPYCRYETVLNNYRLTNTPSDGQILEYNEFLTIQAGSTRIVPDENKAVNLVGARAEISSEEPYQNRTKNTTWLNLVDNSTLWSYYKITFDKEYRDSNYHVMVSAILGESASTSQTYIYNKDSKGFSVLVYGLNDTGKVKMQVYCFGYAK